MIEKYEVKKIERLRATLNFLKVVAFAAVMLAFFSVVVNTFDNSYREGFSIYTKFSVLMFIIAAVCMLVSKRVYKKLRELERRHFF